MAILCSYCEKELDREVFCDSKCRLKYHRNGKPETNRIKTDMNRFKNESKKTGNDMNRFKNESKLTENETNHINNETNRFKDTPYDHLPNRLKPALSWRDDKGQCQHKLKECQSCKV